METKTSVVKPKEIYIHFTVNVINTQNKESNLILEKVCKCWTPHVSKLDRLNLTEF